MTETIYEHRQRKEERTFLYPSNRRQMGSPAEDGMEIFIEDYAFSYAKSLAERDYSGCVAGILVGESTLTEHGEKIRIAGVLEAEHVVSGDVVCFTEENWAGIYRSIREYFPESRIVGWFLGGPGFLLEDEERQKKIQTDNFGGDKVLLKIDSIEQEVSFLSMQKGRMMPLAGYYIYYEKNEGMQSYMMRTGLTPPPAPEHRELPIPLPQEKEELASRMLSKGNVIYRLLYATGGILAGLAVTVIAALAVQINERNHLKQLLNEQEQVVTSVCDVYEVKEGETIERICEEVYGSPEAAEVVRVLNGLSEKENPQAGQKILLP